MSRPAEVYRSVSKLDRHEAFERMIALYEVAIEAAAARNESGVRYCLELLRRTLRPADTPEVVDTLVGLYHTCDRYLDTNDYGAAIELLQGIRDIWMLHEGGIKKTGKTAKDFPDTAV